MSDPFSDRPAKPEPPYYAVIFTSVRAPNEDPAGDAGYDEASDRMAALAATMPGYLGHDSAREPGGIGITVSYWRTQDDIARWRAHPEHARAIKAGKTGWYAWYESATARVERASSISLG